MPGDVVARLWIVRSRTPRWATPVDGCARLSPFSKDGDRLLWLEGYGDFSKGAVEDFLGQVYGFFYRYACGSDSYVDLFLAGEAGPAMMHVPR